ncbi:unnamed protein product [Lactuca virosa]|uniref:RING-type domain-containing protein n=1 Tax=Lactuca virosa TaxID=75947 RepID=A0AAU9MFM3_9ASTR|nr:unnamed protein product [Lactuca virosa]
MADSSGYIFTVSAQQGSKSRWFTSRFLFPAMVAVGGNESATPTTQTPSPVFDGCSARSRFPSVSVIASDRSCLTVLGGQRWQRRREMGELQQIQGLVLSHGFFVNNIPRSKMLMPSIYFFQEVADWSSMGNKLVRKRHQVDEKYTRPQGLYQHKDVDHKKLRKLILDSKLAPCYPGDDDCNCDLEECPICFLYYPSLNRSRCCMKGICTECFLQMKMPNSTRPTQCPFCKTFNYAVEYRGVKTKEEKGLEQIEEQRVIDAQIRMRRREIQDEEERMHRRQDMSSSSRIIEGDDDEIVSIGDSGITNPSGSMHNRNDEFDLDNIMLMEAIWLSFQEDGRRQRNYGDAAQLARYAAELRVSAAVAPPVATTASASPYGGLACTVAREEGSEIGAYGLQDESFEEQMMLAMAVSLSEARGR